MNISVLDGYTLNPGDLVWDRLKTLGNCSIYDRTAPAQVVERCIDATAIFSNKVVITREIMDQLPKLKFIGVLATGINSVDIPAAQEKGIIVTNIPAYSTASVAQMVFSQILNFAQNISTHAASVAAGEWGSSVDFSYRLTPQIELAGKTLGIIGYGSIGQAVAKLALAFDMKVIYHNRSIKSTELDAKQVDMDTVFRESDFLSLNCPQTEATQGFINTENLAKMKKNAFLVNTGRGPLINEQDLADALNNGVIAGAGLDVLSIEPATKDNPLVTAKNCYITPHIAWATLEARARLMNIACDNLVAFNNDTAINVVS